MNNEQLAAELTRWARARQKHFSKPGRHDGFDGSDVLLAAARALRAAGSAPAPEAVPDSPTFTVHNVHPNMLHDVVEALSQIADSYRAGRHVFERGSMVIDVRDGLYAITSDLVLRDTMWRPLDPTGPDRVLDSEFELAPRKTR